MSRNCIVKHHCDGDVFRGISLGCFHRKPRPGIVLCASRHTGSTALALSWASCNSPGHVFCDWKCRSKRIRGACSRRLALLLLQSCSHCLQSHRRPIIIRRREWWTCRHRESSRHRKSSRHSSTKSGDGRALLQRHLDCHQYIEALPHRSNANDTGSSLATGLCFCSLRISLSLLTPNFVIAFFCLEPVAMDLAHIINSMVEKPLCSTAILLHSHPLTGAEKHQISRIWIIHGIVIVGLRSKLQLAGPKRRFWHWDEGGLKANGALGI